MSRNNLVLVAFSVYHKAYYVIPNANADTDWSSTGAAKFIRRKRYLRDRGRALVLAHDIDKRLKTEYGVREVVVRRKDRERVLDEFVIVE